MYTPQRLFGEAGSSSEILAHEPFLERARLQREQASDASARLALGAYVVARLVDKLLLLEQDSAGLDGFRWQLHAVRRHIDELPPDVPEAAHLAGVVAAVPETGRSTSSLWMSLTAYAYFLEHEGRLEESLEVLNLAARSQGSEIPPKEFATYALFAGRLNRQLARWDAANTCYSAAEEAARQAGDMLSALRGRLGRGAVHRGQGNFPLARATAEEVLRDATEGHVVEAQALAYADLGSVYTEQGLRLEALQVQYQAFRLSSDSLQQMRTLGDLAIGLYEIGAFDAARIAFQIVADSNASVLVRANARVELMDLESAAGNRIAFERCRSVAEEYRSRMSPSMLVDYQYKLGVGLNRFGQSTRAREAFTAALAVAETHRLNAWYFKIEQALNTMSQEKVHPVRRQTELSETSMLHEMTAGLREYAAAAAM